jgi:hypothetical protein
MAVLPVLPEYLKVVLEGTAIIICYDNGEREVWDYEPNRKIADEVAKDIELGLKAIDYVSLELEKKINELIEKLVSVGVPEEYVKDYICEGGNKISKLFQALKTCQTALD